MDFEQKYQKDPGMNRVKAISRADFDLPWPKVYFLK